MIYSVAIVLVLMFAMLFRARSMFALLSSQKRMRIGDYDGALRRVRWLTLGLPNVAALHNQGLILSLAGRPQEALRCYQRAMTMAGKGTYYAWERLYACLGYAMIDLRRYEEAEQYFHRAIESGDHTGNSQDGLAELRLVQGMEPERALDYARQAVAHAARQPGARVPGSYYAHEAWALAQIGRREEAREALEKATTVEPVSARSGASLHWRVGMVLLVLEEEAEARKHFRIAAAADPRGKYGRRCAEQLGYCVQTLPPKVVR